MPYVPPHLRPGYVKPDPPAPSKPKRRGAHFRSNETGLPSHNLTHHRYNRNGPTLSSRQVNRIRLLSRRPVKSAIKGKKQTKKQAHSETLKKRKRFTLKAKTR